MTRNELHHRLRHTTSDIALQVRHIKQNIIIIEQIARDMPDYSSMIQVKSATIMRELIVVPWHPMLKEIIFWTIEQYPGLIVFTSGFRIGGGVHGQDPLRGIDLRSREFDKPRDVEYRINQKWNYGKEPYQVALYHQTVRCEKCKTKFEVDPDIGVIASTACPKCHAGGGFLKDFKPHFHLQCRSESSKRL